MLESWILKATKMLKIGKIFKLILMSSIKWSSELLLIHSDTSFSITIDLGF